VQPKLASKSPSFCLHLPSADITDICQHAQLNMIFSRAKFCFFNFEDFSFMDCTIATVSKESA
jgi:hypothetical protein